MGTKETGKRIILPVVDILKEAKEDELAYEEVKELMEYEQFIVFEDLIANNIEPDERWEVYLRGFNASEIGKETGFTRANIAARISSQIKGRKEELDKKHRDNRKKLFKARDWYLYVYLSDKEGDFRQMEEYLPERLRNDAYMYRKYKEHGGKDLEKDFIDRRHRITAERKTRILEGLKDKPIEQVAFQERVYLNNVQRIAEENDVDYFSEADNKEGGREYTEKLNVWMRRKREHNLKAGQKKIGRESEKEGKKETTEKNNE